MTGTGNQDSCKPDQGCQLGVFVASHLPLQQVEPCHFADPSRMLVRQLCVLLLLLDP